MHYTQNSTFDRDIAGELWEQADVNYNNGAEVQQLAEIIEDAQNILIDKRRELNGSFWNNVVALEGLYARQRQISQGAQRNSQDRRQELESVSHQIMEIEKDLREYTDDLYFVSTPFGIDLGAIPRGPPVGSNSKISSPVGPAFGMEPHTPV